MKITYFERLVIEEIYDDEIYEEYLERNMAKIDCEINEDRNLTEVEIEHFETSTLEYLEEIAKIEFLDDENLKERVLKGDIDSKDEVITKSLRIPVLAGIILLKNGVNYLDLIQEGTIALIHSVEKFPSSGYKSFEDYAKINIFRRMIIYINERLQESKAEFIAHFHSLEEEFDEREDVMEELENKIKNIKEIEYNTLFSSLNKQEVEVLEKFYGLKNGKRESMYQIEESLKLEKGQGQELFQKAINKISNFEGEFFII